MNRSVTLHLDDNNRAIAWGWTMREDDGELTGMSVKPFLRPTLPQAALAVALLDLELRGTQLTLPF